MKIRFTPSARKQFLAAISYIAADNRQAAINFHQKASERLKQLQSFPLSGRHLPEFPDLPFRELVIPPYRFFYRIQAEELWIVAVWHGAQLPAKPE